MGHCRGSISHIIIFVNNLKNIQVFMKMTIKDIFLSNYFFFLKHPKMLQSVFSLAK